MELVIQQIIEESGWKWAKMALNEILSSGKNANGFLEFQISNIPFASDSCDFHTLRFLNNYTLMIFHRFPISR